MSPGTDRVPRSPGTPRRLGVGDRNKGRAGAAPVGGAVAPPRRTAPDPADRARRPNPPGRPAVPPGGSAEVPGEEVDLCADDVLEVRVEVRLEVAAVVRQDLGARDARRGPPRDADGGDDVTAILDALRANNPEDANAAETIMTKRQAGDVDSILAALRENNPEDADAAATLSKRSL